MERKLVRLVVEPSKFGLNVVGVVLIDFALSFTHRTKLTAVAGKTLSG